jgi:hypothetical protein
MPWAASIARAEYWLAWPSSNVSETIVRGEDVLAADAP